MQTCSRAAHHGTSSQQQSLCDSDAALRVETRYRETSTAVNEYHFLILILRVFCESLMYAILPGLRTQGSSRRTRHSFNTLKCS